MPPSNVFPIIGVTLIIYIEYNFYMEIILLISLQCGFFYIAVKVLSDIILCCVMKLLHDFVT
jgi:hypothetical protein